jgi:hypothetical protein
MMNFRNSRLLHVAGLIICSLAWLANDNNPPNGYTGAPFDSNCNSCHGGNNSGGYNATIAINGLPSTIQPSTAYSLNITVTPTAGNPVRAGFQLVVVAGDNTNAGTLTAGNSQSGTNTAGGHTYLEHRNGKNFGGNPVTWTFNWTSPATASGNTIKFYYISLLANNNGGTSGDHPVNSSITLPFNAPPPITASASGTNVSCNGGNNGTATVTATGGTPPYTYHWSNGQTTQTATSLTAGTYTVTVTGGTTATASTTITQPTAILLSTAANGAITCAVPSIPVTATVSGGTPSYSYAWSNGKTTNPASYSTISAYTVTVTDANGCTKTATGITSGDITPPVAVASAGGTITCNTPTTTVTATGSSTGTNITYAWSTTNGNIVSGATSITAVVNATGTYTTTVTNTTNGCTKTASVTVTGSTTSPGGAAMGGTLTCAVTSITISAISTTQGVTYTWGGPGGFTSMQQNPVVNTPGDYTVTITDPSNGCISTATATVNQDITQPDAAASGGTLTCAVPSLYLNATSGTPNVTFEWSGPGSFMSTEQNPLINDGGTYILTVTKDNGCTSTAQTTVAINNTLPVATASVPGNLNCNNASIQINGTGSSQGAYFTYNWTAANGGHIVSGDSTLTPVVDSAGSYRLVVLNTENGCTASVDTIVVQSLPVTAAIGNISNVSCNGATDGSATAIPGGGNGTYTYLWSNGATTAGISSLAAGTYQVIITDGENCTATSPVSIGQPDLLQANAIATRETAAGANNGNASASPSGGTTPFGYAWSNGDTTTTITGLTPGSYTVSVTDAHNCQAIQTVTVNSVDCNLAAGIAGINVSCNGAQNGAANVTLTGATNPVIYTWSNGAMTDSIAGLSPGTYTVQILDGAGCPATLNIDITEPSLLSANATAMGETAFGANNGTAAAQPAGGTAPYTFTWSNGATTAAISGLMPGNYTVTVIDNHGCTHMQTVNVAQYTCSVVAEISSSDVTCPGENNGQATVTLNGGSAPYTYHWSNGSTTATAGSLGTGDFTATVTDAFGCTAVQHTTISSGDHTPPTLSCPGNIAICGADIVDYPTPTASDNCNLNGATPILVSGLPSGSAFTDGVTTQVFSVTDASGNASTCSFSVTVFGVPDVSVDQVTDDISGNGEGSISITPSAGVAPFVYIWSKDGVFFSNSEDLTGLFSGSYGLTLSDANGCSTILTPIVIKHPVATSAPLDGVSIRLVPNPASNIIRIDLTGTQPIFAQILDSHGRLMLDIQPFQLFNNIEITQLPIGLYYMKILLETGNWYVLKWVKSE